MDSLLEAAHSLLQANTETVKFEGRVLALLRSLEALVPSSVALGLGLPRHRLVALRPRPRLRRAALALSLAGAERLHPARRLLALRSALPAQHWHYLESAGLWSFLPRRRPRTTALTQPPVLATAVERLVLAGAEDFLAEALPVLERYYRYLASERDPDRDGLISTISQFETGLDFSPAYDQAIGAGPRAALEIARQLAPRRDQEQARRLRPRADLRPRRSRRRRAREHHLDRQSQGACPPGPPRRADGAGRLGRGQDPAQALQSLLERAWDPKRGLFFNLVGSAETRPRRRRSSACCRCCSRICRPRSRSACLPT